MEISNIKINNAIYYFKDKIGRSLINSCNETSNLALSNSSTALSVANAKSTISIERKSVDLTLSGGVGYIDLGAQPSNVIFITNGGNYKGVSDVLCRTAVLSNRYLRAQSTDYPTATFTLYYLKITIS